jgi:OOP family OmpA-OmpF porin
LNFDTNKTTLKKASEMKFPETIENLRKKIPDLRRIIVEGHTDNVGTDARNMKLSQGRAETVRALLIRHLGLSADQVKAVGRGESRPVASNDNAEGRSKNRRVELKIYRNK